jgi:large subunit ribosomal protein L5
MSAKKTPGAKTSGKKGNDYGLQLVRGEHTKGVKPRYQVKQEEARKKFLSERPGLNIHEVPKLVKIVVNTCQGEATQNIKVLEASLLELEAITGQKAVTTRAKKSISTFKLRAGMPIGGAITLRRERMYEFFDRLVNVALPRVRDFRGCSDKSFDGNGNYSLGIKDQSIFPELEADKIDKSRGLSVTIVTSGKTDADARALLSLMDWPFRK